MRGTSYEEALIGRCANDDKRPPRPSVIEIARNVIGRENLRFEVNGAYYVWEMGAWRGPLKLDALMRAANSRLRAQGRPQISINPSWLIKEGNHVNP